MSWIRCEVAAPAAGGVTRTPAPVPRTRTAPSVAEATEGRAVIARGGFPNGWLGGRDSQKAADILLGAGIVTAVPTVATGLSDWADTEPGNDTVRRVGIAHAALNGNRVGG